uniref:Ubiquitin-like protease family profile domain-containing protein n=1 Tax=Denticeps clupeoides TaxID=299321 RepID=A0AAY4CMD5_9TELE
MAHKKSLFIEALNRSEAKRDGGYRQSWSFSLSGDSDDEERHHTFVSMDEAKGQRELSPDGLKSPPLKTFSSTEPLRTYERRPIHQNHFRMGNKTATNKMLSEIPVAMSQMPSRNNCFVLGATPSQSVMVQGRLFQQAHGPQAVQKMAQRNDFMTQSAHRVAIDSIVLTCPEISGPDNLNIMRRTQHKRRPAHETTGSFSSAAPLVEPLQPDEYLSICGKCNKSSEDHTKCTNCGHALPAEASHAVEPPASIPPRPPIRSQPSPGPNGLPAKNFYSPGAGVRTTLVNMNPPARITRSNVMMPQNGGRTYVGLSGNVTTTYVTKITQEKKQAVTKPHELNDPIVLSSDDEEDEADNASTGSVNQLDSVSPRPADSAHSSPAPSSGKVEAAVKGTVEQDELMPDCFTEVNPRMSLPRKPRMKDVSGNTVCEEHSPTKKRKVNLPYKLESIILECRSVRIGTLRRMVTKPVIFSSEYIQLETEGKEVDTVDKVRLQTSQLTSCEWCNVRKLPVLFLKTSPTECQRLRQQLSMSQENGDLWYDCNSSKTYEKFIVLIFENGLTLHEQTILEEILVEIGRANNLKNFPSSLPFNDANNRLVQYTKAAKDKEKEHTQKPTTASAAPAVTAMATSTTTTTTTSAPGPTVQTRMSTRRRGVFEENDEDDDVAEPQSTFTGPVVKLMVYPPPPAKGGISVTNEDLHCLSDGEFLNDVIIDFYLKYLFLEKLKKEDAGRSHVFSSFFYKRLNQRERRTVADTTNLPIQKRKHNRVKTWTRHVDLFQKDFIFVPINESAHWYLAVICFPGLEGPETEPNPHYRPPAQPSSPAPSTGREESLAPSNPPVFDCTESCLEANHQPRGGPACPRMTQEASCASQHGVNDQNNIQPQYTDGLHRISICYGSRGNDDDPFTFSDDQSSSQDECSEDGTLAEESLNSESMEWTSKPTNCKQPCILIMDSLRGPTRSTVVKTLREYLEVEWEVKKGTQRSFGKDVMKGSSPRVPQQDNFSDCGVYILQYVESFFENPIPSFHLPMNLSEWFAQQRMKRKRDEIKELILILQSQQQSEPGLCHSQASNGDGDKDFEDPDGLDVQDLPVCS